ncbi:MAG: hypothetical protein ACJARN_002216 [Arenicella sp.]|jgi:hypothetical protein
MRLNFSSWLAPIALSLLLVSGLVSAAPKAKLQEFWLAHDHTSTIKVSHQAWQAILDKYLDDDHLSGVNRFDYAAVKKADRKSLGDYIDGLQAVDPHTLAKPEQLAYWLNFYNALTVQVVLQDYPVESIRSIRFLSSPFGPWDKNLVKVNNKRLSLNDIEHTILRPIWSDPRIHFAVNCASIGCPNLIGEAFTATNSGQLMEAAASDFINHIRGVELGVRAVRLSSIFDWFSDDFGVSEPELVSYLNQYLDGQKIKFTGDTKLEYHYDWALNKP